MPWRHRNESTSNPTTSAFHRYAASVTKTNTVRIAIEVTSTIKPYGIHMRSTPLSACCENYSAAVRWHYLENSRTRFLPRGTSNLRHLIFLLQTRQTCNSDIIKLEV